MTFLFLWELNSLVCFPQVVLGIQGSPHGVSAVTENHITAGWLGSGDREQCFFPAKSILLEGWHAFLSSDFQ